MKGISPLIAGVLLIAFTLAVAAIIGGWLTSTVREETTQVGTGFALQVNCTKAALDIVDVVCINPVEADTGSVNVTITVANTGPIGLVSPSFLFRSNNQDICTSSFTDTIAPGSTALFRVNCSNPIYGFTDTEFLTYTRASMNCQNQITIFAEETLSNLCDD
ncbi:MAG: hypothetical protein J4428_04770 [Candidatus Aenigmarchaeota archaeon]|nr:hypothetical protein [Candidatus Aenigmarchaeota archaeon]